MSLLHQQRNIPDIQCDHLPPCKSNVIMLVKMHSMSWERIKNVPNKFSVCLFAASFMCLRVRSITLKSIFRVVRTYNTYKKMKQNNSAQPDIYLACPVACLVRRIPAIVSAVAGLALGIHLASFLAFPCLILSSTGLDITILGASWTTSTRSSACPPKGRPRSLSVSLL